MNIYKVIGTSSLALALAFGLNSCKKDYLDTKPSTQVPLEDVFKTTAGAKNVLNGMHRKLFAYGGDHDLFGMPSINMQYDLLGEDFGLSESGLGWFTRAYSDAQNGTAAPWDLYYSIVTNANFILTNIEEAKGPEMERNEVKGQAYAYRAWAYLQLIQTYQFPYGGLKYIVDGGSGNYGVVGEGATPSQALGVPLYTEPTKKPHARASLREIITQIDNDLDSSIVNFEKGATNRGSDKSQINGNIAHGLKARSALYQRKWAVAASEAELARQGLFLSSGNALLDGFNSTSAGEWMWGAVINSEQNGIYASFLSHMDPKVGGYASWAEKIIANPLIREMPLVPFSKAIDSNDTRAHWWNPSSRAKWPGYEDYKYRSQLKFRAPSEASFAGDYPYMRVPEMYLIEAEAKALANDLPGAKAVLEEFAKTRQFDYDASAYNTKDLLVHEIWRQRRLELWGEGFRFFDAKRQMVVSSGVTPLQDINRAQSGFYLGSQPATVSAYSNYLYYLIPGSEITNNKACLQNPPRI
ncbi:MAG TPA: RagB/SusD family nutrient uptake outer membrane protein [Edaphocola sp.]|nr:RagB/SusD family nutrient uptake outer membrane protein [Edaphocola sp.]